MFVSDQGREFQLRDRATHAAMCAYLRNILDQENAWERLPALQLPLPGGAGLRVISTDAASLSGLLPASDFWIVLDLADHSRQSIALIAQASGLTEAEVHVLEHLVEGASRAEIAHCRKVGLETVKSQTASILRKLDARDRQELMRRFR